MVSAPESRDHVPEGAHWVWRPRARRVYLAPGLADCLGSDAELTTTALLALIHGEDRDWLWRVSRRARRTSAPFAAACRVLAPDGRARWLTLHGRWRHGFDAAPELAGIILEAQQAQQAPHDQLPLLDMARLRQALRASEAREEARSAELQTVLDAVPAIVWVAHDPACQVITGNRAAQAFLRMAPGSNLSKSAPDAERPAHFRVMKEGVELAPEELPVQLAARGIAVEDFEEEVVFDDGTVRTLLGNATPLWDADGRPRGAVAAFLDITERHEGERERLALLAAARAARAAAELALRQRDELIGAVTHDLKNPLTAILGHAQLLQRRLTQPEVELDRAVRTAHMVERAARQMLVQIDELLDVEQLHGGEPVELRREPSDLAALVQRVVETFQHTTDAHQFVVAAAPGLPHVPLDPVRVERALSNLLANALKYSPAGGTVTVSVAVAVEAAARPALVLTVQDEGVGIPAEDLPHVFERYRRASNAQAIPGTGLGLTNARHIIEQHGGTIAVASSEGAGTLVTIRLPLE